MLRFDIKRNSEYPRFYEACSSEKEKYEINEVDSRYYKVYQHSIKADYKPWGEKYVPTLNTILDPADTKPRESPVENQELVLSHTKRGTLHAYLTYLQKRRPIIMLVKWDKARVRPAVMTDGRHSR